MSRVPKVLNRQTREVVGLINGGCKVSHVVNVKGVPNLAVEPLEFIPVSFINGKARAQWF